MKNMVQTLSERGYKTQVQTLSHFYDDYGLKADDEDGEEEDDDEEEEGDLDADMSEGSYESGSEEDDD